MLDTLLAVVGILVSLVLFFIGYRQTVGATAAASLVVIACWVALHRILASPAGSRARSPRAGQIGKRPSQNRPGEGLIDACVGRRIDALWYDCAHRAARRCESESRGAGRNSQCEPPKLPPSNAGD